MPIKSDKKKVVTQKNTPKKIKNNKKKKKKTKNAKKRTLKNKKSDMQEVNLKITGWKQFILEDFDNFMKKENEAFKKVESWGIYVIGQSGNNGGHYVFHVLKKNVSKFKEVAKNAFSSIGLKVSFTKSLDGLDGGSRH